MSDADLSEPQKAIYTAFLIAGLKDIKIFRATSGVRYVTGDIDDKHYIFSHKDYLQYILSCNDNTLIATRDPTELRQMLDKIMENPKANIEKSHNSIF